MPDQGQVRVMGEETGLPASFELTWGVRDRPTKGPKRGLSLAQVVDAGVRVANAEGIGGVSMSGVAKELGTSAMALYRYVASKDELLALMVDAAFGQIEWELTGETWRERLASWSGIELAAYRRFPWVIRIPVSNAPILPNQLRFVEHGLRAMGGTGLAEDEKMSVILLITSFTRSFALLSGDLVAAIESGDQLARASLQYGQLVKNLTSAEEFPALHAVVDAGTFDDPAGLDPSINPDGEGLAYDFRFGLARILDGVEALVRQRG